MKIQTERLYPIAGALVAVLCWIVLEIRIPSDEKEFLAAALSLGAILTGFIATAKAILASLPSDTVMGRLRSSGYIDDLIVYLAHALYGCFGFSVFCLMGFFFVKSGKAEMPNWFGAIWAFLGVFSALSFIRVSRLLFRILKVAPGNGQ